MRFSGPIFILIFLGPIFSLTAKPFNVLFISIDDLRPALGCYGDKTALTPNIDQLAKRSILFNRAYCQQAVCCPSRLSLLTGLRPDTIKVWDLATHFREAKPQAITLPQHFKNHGYHTRSIGKIFHGGGKPSKGKGKERATSPGPAPHSDSDGQDDDGQEGIDELCTAASICGQIAVEWGMDRETVGTNFNLHADAGGSEDVGFGCGHLRHQWIESATGHKTEAYASIHCQ